MGARVLAVASGYDGVAFVRGLGADQVVDGYKEDVLAAARRFAPDGLDAVLLTTVGEAAEKSLAALKTGGRVAYPNGLQPVSLWIKPPTLNVRSMITPWASSH
jgi:NADPH:quinone reductase